MLKDSEGQDNLKLLTQFLFCVDSSTSLAMIMKISRKNFRGVLQIHLREFTQE